MFPKKSGLERWRSRFAFLWLFLGWLSIAQAQNLSPPAPASKSRAARALSVEDRLQKLEAMNQMLLQQNQQLTRQLKTVTEQLTKPGAAGPPAGNAPPGEPNALRREPSTASAVGGGDLVAPSGRGATSETGGGGGIGGNVPRREPSTASAVGGGDLVIPPGSTDAPGIGMKARFGRRFVNNGLWFESPNKNFQIHIGGRSQFDSSTFAAGNTVQFGSRGIGKLRDGVDPRRARIRLEGFMYEQFVYVMEWDFANTSIAQGTAGAGPLTSTANTPAASVPAPQDLWIGFRKLPIIGNLRIGNMKEPFGFERLTSSRFLNFMERSYNNDAFYSTFTNGFIPGVQMFNTAFNLHATWAVGLFKNVTNPFDFQVGGGDYAESARLTFLPLYEDEGREVMHLGITGRNSGFDNGKARFRVRGPERLGLPAVWALYADTGVINANGGQQDLNLEYASVFGPWTIDAEYDFHFIQNAFLPGKPSVDTLFYSGGYVEILYFLTGEHRAYIRESALFDRIVPRKNAYWVKGKDGQPNECGPGAWQLGIRYNYLNLNDKGINGGVLQDITAGLNWFINPNMKFQWNYTVTVRHSPTGLSDGTIQGFGMRYAMDY